MDRGYVIKVDAAFYDGRGAFVDEYPDANVYRKAPSSKVVRAAFLAAAEMGYNGMSVDVIHNYGFEDERSQTIYFDIDEVQD